MKYTLDLTAPEFEALTQAAERHLIAVSSIHRMLGERMGRGADVVVAAGVDVKTAERVRQALKDAADKAVLERAIPSLDNDNLRTPHSMQVADDMPLVYGRPRNDPREPRRKTSNIARRPIKP